MKEPVQMVCSNPKFGTAYFQERPWAIYEVFYQKQAQKTFDFNTVII